jgi:EAL domain-containing protein (putative c-di-GMP-specific phosphodiesterase class I)
MIEVTETFLVEDGDHSATQLAELRRLGMRIAEAEGIETAAQAAVLRNFGWELGQGYHFGRPVDGPTMTTMLEERTRD